MFKGKVPSTHHATDATWSKWIALITQRARIGNPNCPAILEIITNWPEGENFGLTDEEEQEQVTRAKEGPPYNQLPAEETRYALFTDGSCRIVGMNRKWKAAVWSPTRQVAQATEGEGGSSQLAELKAVQLALYIAEREKWPKLYLYTDSWMVANALWGWLDRWKKANWQRRGKPIWAADEWKDIATRVEKLPVKVRHVDAHVPKSRANEEHRNNEQVDQAAKTEVSKIDLDWQHKGELFLARWAHDASGHQGRDATYKWARDRGVDLTMDSISQVIHDCETCAAIKQAKRVKPLWYGGRWSKYKYGEAWQIDYITLPQTRQGKRYVLTMVEATTGWLETYPVPHATARNTILGLEKQILWRHGTPERTESDNGTHFKNRLINTWAREHGIEWVYHIPYHASAAGKVERCNGLLKTTLKALGGGTFKNWENNLAKATWLVNTRGSTNRAGPAQSEPLGTRDGDKVPVVHERTEDRSRGDGGFGSTGPPQVRWTAVLTKDRPETLCTVSMAGATPSEIHLRGLLDTGANWQVDRPIWENQWPLPHDKLVALRELVQAQLDQGHLEPSTSPWNTPVFCIKKKSGKWRLLQDLRKINAVMEGMGTLQAGMPSPTMLPADWPVLIVDLKDGFFTIPLHPDDRPKFAFTVPTINNAEPAQWYQWKVLHQGMRNFPVLRQWYVASALSGACKQFPDAHIYHYMDDILMATPTQDELLRLQPQLLDALHSHGLQVAPEKVQQQPPWKYLGVKILERTICQQEVQFVQSVKTLNDAQKLVGVITWLRPYLGLTIAQLSPLFELLKGDTDLKSPRELTPEARKVLEEVQQAVSACQVYSIEPSIDVTVFITTPDLHPTGIISQWNDDWTDPLHVLEWVFLPHQLHKMVTALFELIVRLIINSQEPVQGPTVFTDGSGKTGKSIVTWQDGSEWQVLESHEDGSAQLVEIRAAVMAFEKFSQEPFNFITDSTYVADIAQRLSCSVLKEVSNPALFHLLKALWCAIQARVHPYYVLHVRSHTNLPGFVAEGNARADKLANPAWVAPQPDVLAQAKASHGFFHQNAHTLQKQFQLMATEACEIVESCDDCHALGAPLPAGVNPRGLKALELWQTDVTQVAEFGRLKYVHVTVDTFSSAMWASAHTGEKARDVIAHWRQAFAVLGIPSAVKTDNGPAYASQQALDGEQQPRAKILGHAGYLQSVSVLTCDHRGRIWLTGKVEVVINLKATKWMNPQVITLMIPPQ
ncbi:hypothetical protein DUI87_01496 [Hirundo rustica rustica]|uniref:Uncharacterized protein n=1 Tax=Hirundo rustica rustica TaxID=333673 RepID=A0A3M0L9K1_HIRRU|nr:hypothetical protein DUI87_01496 [Hirundo rustica rustica]